MNKFLILCGLSLLGFGLTRADEQIAYGAGEMLRPARTLYVTLNGNDDHDGLTPDTAWRSIRRGVHELRAGDTLLVGAGEYREAEIPINVQDDTPNYTAQCGEPGAPIRIMAMPEARVVLRGADFLPVGEKLSDSAAHIFNPGRRTLYGRIWEAPAQIELQPVRTPELLYEYPGTYYLEESGRLLVHFVARQPTGVYFGHNRIGIRIHGSRIHLENLIFENFSEAIYLRMNKPYEQNIAEHITIKGCEFYHNWATGVTIDGASRSLFIGNRGATNGGYGCMRTLGLKAHDNLITGNYFGESPLTMRQSPPYVHNFLLSNYGPGGVRNHIIGNVLESKLAFRWKAGCPESRFEDNIVNGNFYAESPVIPAAIHRNFFGSDIGWASLGHNLWDENFAGTPIQFSANVRQREEFKPTNPIAFTAEKMRTVLPSIDLPAVTFHNLRADYITPDSAVIFWETPDNDGLGAVEYRRKGERSFSRSTSSTQGVHHVVGMTGLEPNTEYEFVARFNGRRGESAQTPIGTFTTTIEPRAPRVLEVGPGKMTLAVANVAAIAGDTILLAPGRHFGPFLPLRSGTPGHPITLTGPGAILDGQFFYAPLVDVANKSYLVIDGITFANPEEETRIGIIRMNNVEHVTIRNCKADFPWQGGPFVIFRSSSNLLVENNISRGGDYPLTFAGCTNVVIRRNTIVDATMWSAQFWEVDNLEIRDNIFFRPCIDNKRNTAMLLHNMQERKVTSDGNVFFSFIAEHPVGGTLRDSNAKVIFSSRTLAEWQQQTGWDRNSLHLDPLFVDYENGDLRLQPNSPAQGKGADIP